MPKVTIVGAGQTGATTAHWMAERDLADVVLIDVVEGMPQGKGLDLAQAMPIIGSDSRVSGTNDYADTAGSDIVIITAGLPRKPGMSRDDLLEANSRIVREAVERSLAASPEAILVILTNPLDAMAYPGDEGRRVAAPAGHRTGGDPRTRPACGLSSPPSSSVSVQNVHCYVLGRSRRRDGAADAAFECRRCAADQALSADRLAAIVDRTRKGGGEIVGLLKTGQRVLRAGGGAGSDGRGDPARPAPDRARPRPTWRASTG